MQWKQLAVLQDLGLKNALKVYQSGKGGTTISGGNRSTKKWREGTAAEGFDMVEQSTDITEIKELHLMENKMRLDSR